MIRMNILRFLCITCVSALLCGEGLADSNVVLEFAALDRQWPTDIASGFDAPLRAEREIKTLLTSTVAFRKDGILTIKTEAGQRRYANTFPLPANVEHWEPGGVLHFYVGEIPSLHTAIVERLQRGIPKRDLVNYESEMRYYEMVDLRSGKSTPAIPTLSPLLRKDGKRLAFLLFNDEEDTLRGIQVFDIGGRDLQHVSYRLKEDPPCYDFTSPVLSVKYWWKDYTHLAASYHTRTALFNEAPLDYHDTCIFKVK